MHVTIKNLRTVADIWIDEFDDNQKHSKLRISRRWINCYLQISRDGTISCTIDENSRSIDLSMEWKGREWNGRNEE